MKQLFLIPIFATFFTFPVMADHYNCNEHAAHIDKVIGLEKALDAYHILHGDKDDVNNIIDQLKQNLPDIELELEEYLIAGCGEAELRAHAHDHLRQ